MTSSKQQSNLRNTKEDTTLRKYVSVDYFNRTQPNAMLPPATEITPFANRVPDLSTVNAWFGGLVEFQRFSSTTTDFYQKTVNLICNPGGLEEGIFLLRKKDEWEINAKTASSDLQLDPQMRPLLAKLLYEEKTCFHSSTESREILKQGTAVVATPLKNKAGEIIGALWGNRHVTQENQRLGIRQLEMQWFELLGEVVSAGLIRLEEERQHAQTQVLLDQVFPENVSKQLKQNPDLLAGQEREITLLFADLRRSTHLTEILGSRETYQLLSEIMNSLTNVAMQYQGVLIDYYGDGMAVMWNAPTDQPQHAALACQAALEMQRAIEETNHKWEPQLGERIQLGIGIHTGIALVGNSGSSKRIKYGPRGQTVNIASRIETSTKKLRASIVISHTTAQHLSNDFALRRLCTVQYPNIATELKLSELCTASASELTVEEKDFIHSYENGLKLYESQDFAAAFDNFALLEQNKLSHKYSVEFMKNYLASLCEPNRQRRQADKRQSETAGTTIFFE